MRDGSEAGVGFVSDGSASSRGGMPGGRWGASAWVLLLLCLMAGLAHGADYTVAPASGWVVRHEMDREPAVPDGDISGGTYYLLLDRQIWKDAGVISDYRHDAMRVVNQQGVDGNASLSIDFDPEYQKLVIHQVLRHRNGEMADLLKTSDVTLLHREEEMEYRIYNGMRTLNLIFKDIRVGDTVEYSYTIVGENPVFRGALYRFCYLGWSVPVHTYRLRMSVPEGEPLHYRMFNTDTTPEETVGGGMKHLEVFLPPVPSYRYAGETPEWSDPYPSIQVSQTESWSEVVDWATDFYTKKHALSPELASRIETIAQEAESPEERIVRALECVQDEVRYLGIEIGEGTHVPTDPSTVFARRFGDCKDKALLFCTMAREMGISAWPVLVSSWMNGEVGLRLPSPTVFNHVIAMVRLGDRNYWFDPTATHERGSLERRSQANYGRGLVVRVGESHLTSMDRPPASLPDRQVFMHFDLSDDATAPARLTVRTIMHFGVADEFRYSLEMKGRKGMAEDLRDFYTPSYPGLREEKPFEVSDTAKNNEVILTEHYIIEDFWEKESESLFIADIYPREVGAFLKKPRVADRKVPFEVTHPVHIRLLTTCTLPTGWDVSRESLHRKNRVMSFDYKLTTAGNDLMLYCDYRTTADHVRPDEIEGYMSVVEEIKNTIDYSITLSTKFASDTPAAFTLESAVAMGRETAAKHGLAFLVGVGVGCVLSLCLVLGARRFRRVAGSGAA